MPLGSDQHIGIIHTMGSPTARWLLVLHRLVLTTTLFGSQVIGKADTDTDTGFLATGNK